MNRLGLCRPLLSCVAALVLASSAAAGDARYEFHHDHVLGTSLDIEVTAASSAAAQAAEAAVLSEIERLAKILSTYDATSEFSRWQRGGHEAQPVSADLLAVMQHCDHWRSRSQGAFNVAAGAACELWKAAGKRNQLPSAAEIAAAVKLMETPAWSLDSAQKAAARTSDAPFTLDALAKGYIVDRAAAAALKIPEIRGAMVNIGGDLRTTGAHTQIVSVANPFADAENAAPIARLHLRDHAIATSGNYRRGVTIAGRHYSHIVDPRTGRPVDHVASASVIASTAAAADALATIFSVLPISESLQLAARLPGVECLLVGSDRSFHATPGWKKFVSFPSDVLALAQADPPPAAAEKSATGWGKDFELVVNYEIDKPAGNRGYKRPYIAIWIADTDGKPVRTLTLSIQKNGQKWLRDLRKWYKDDKARLEDDEKNLVGTISSATRSPGEYKVVWDGKDDHEQPLPAGKYQVYIEAAREHGTYQLIRQEIEIAEKEFTTEVKGNVEIKGATLEFRRLPAAK